MSNNTNRTVTKLCLTRRENKRIKMWDAMRDNNSIRRGTMLKFFQYACSASAVGCLLFTYYHMLKKDKQS
jgi:hypothetical protein